MTLDSAWGQISEFFDKKAIIKEGKQITEFSGGGASGASVYRYKNNIWKLYPDEHHYELEKKCYQDIRDKEIIPEAESDDQNLIIRMADAGEAIKKHNIPKDFDRQCERINSALAEAKIYHNDLHNENIRVDKDGRLRIIDFDLSTRSPHPGEGENDCCNFWYKS